MFATRSEKQPYYLSFWMFVWGEIASKSFKNPFGNRNKNLLDFSSDFFMVLGRFWTLWATLGSGRGWSTNRVFSVQHRPGTQNGSKTSPKSLWDTPEPQISMIFLRFLIEFGYDFSLFVGFGTVAGRPKAIGYYTSDDPKQKKEHMTGTIRPRL